MLRPRTLKILAALLTGYVLLVIPAYLGPSCLEEVSSRFAMMPLLSIYILHSVGIPGLLEHGGACGWGWCAPSAFGWAVLVLLWLAIAWLSAWGVARVTARSRPDTP